MSSGPRGSPGFGPGARGVPVLLVVVLEYCLDHELEHFPALLRLAFRPFSPVVVAGFRYAEPFAHLRDRGSLVLLRRGCVLSTDERVFLAHRCSLAKYAAAFFKKAFSISRSRTRRSSSFTRSGSGMPAGSGFLAIFFRYADTQRPSVVSFTSSSLATCETLSEPSTTFLAACSLNSGV